MPQRRRPQARRRCGRPWGTSCFDKPGLDRIMSEARTRAPVAEAPTTRRSRAPVPAVIIVSVLFVVMVGLSIWYLSRREPLVIQGEVQSRTFDMAARVDGRIAEIVVSRS